METKIIERFSINPDEVKKGMVEGKSHICHDASTGVFAVSNGKEGFVFTLSNEDFRRLLTQSGKGVRIVFEGGVN